jgi:hypothetical protein
MWLPQSGHVWLVMRPIFVEQETPESCPHSDVLVDPLAGPAGRGVLPHR